MPGGWFTPSRQWSRGISVCTWAPFPTAQATSTLPIWLAGGCNIMLDHFETSHTLDVIEQERH